MHRISGPKTRIALASLEKAVLPTELVKQWFKFLYKYLPDYWTYCCSRGPPSKIYQHPPVEALQSTTPRLQRLYRLCVGQSPTSLLCAASRMLFGCVLSFSFYSIIRGFVVNVLVEDMLVILILLFTQWQLWRYSWTAQSAACEALQQLEVGTTIPPPPPSPPSPS